MNDQTVRDKIHLLCKDLTDTLEKHSSTIDVLIDDAVDKIQDSDVKIPIDTTATTEETKVETEEIKDVDLSSESIFEQSVKPKQGTIQIVMAPTS